MFYAVYRKSSSKKPDLSDVMRDVSRQAWNENADIIDALLSSTIGAVELTVSAIDATVASVDNTKTQIFKFSNICGGVCYLNVLGSITRSTETDVAIINNINLTKTLTFVGISSRSDGREIRDIIIKINTNGTVSVLPIETNVTADSYIIFDFLSIISQ